MIRGGGGHSFRLFNVIVKRQKIYQVVFFKSDQKLNLRFWKLKFLCTTFRHLVGDCSYTGRTRKRWIVQRTWHTAIVQCKQTHMIWYWIWSTVFWFSVYIQGQYRPHIRTVNQSSHSSEVIMYNACTNV